MNINIVRICYPLQALSFCVVQNTNAKIQRRNYISHKAVRVGWSEKELYEGSVVPVQ